MVQGFPYSISLLGGEEGRTGGWSAMDPSHRRISAPAVSAGSLSKQKNPVGNESAVSKDAVVSQLCFCSSYHGPYC